MSNTFSMKCQCQKNTNRSIIVIITVDDWRFNLIVCFFSSYKKKREREK